MNTPTRKVPTIIMVAGLLVALVHATLGLTDVMSTFQWVSGVIVGVLIAGVGNHLRIFGHR